MFKKYHVAFMTLFYVLDISLTLLAFLGAGFLNDRPSFQPVIAVATLQTVPSAYLLITAIWAVSFRIFPLYTSKRVASLGREMFVVGEAVVFSWCVFVAVALLFDLVEPLRPIALSFVILDLLLLLGFHFILRLLLRFLRSRRYNLKQVLIVGAGTVGHLVARQLQEHPWAGFSILGFLDDNPSLRETNVDSISVLGSLAEAHSIVEQMHPLDEVIIALPATAHQQVENVIQAIQDLPVNVRVVPDLFGVASIRPSIEDLWGIPLIGIRQPVITGPRAAAKRATDIIGGFLGLLCFSPLMILIAIAIKLDSKGPVVFAQERAGENNQPFRIYKFRTMVDGSEKMLDGLIDLDQLAEPVFKLKNDPRVTRIGRILRRASLDELPQLVNVIKGDMSLVGPRPEETQMVRRYNGWHRKRLMVKPGMTGPAQVSGRADLSLKERVQLELDYISNYSFRKDIKILLKTIPAVIRGDGSY
jgi:exopolysaccharide biosynthesis polyprenyl glycosylphosphotransferase